MKLLGILVSSSHALVTPPASATSTGKTKTSRPAWSPKTRSRPAITTRIDVMAPALPRRGSTQRRAQWHHVSLGRRGHVDPEPPDRLQR
jgi:hypothetical protein